jgi:hypothetical protein
MTGNDTRLITGLASPQAGIKGHLLCVMLLLFTCWSISGDKELLDELFAGQIYWWY